LVSPSLAEVAAYLGLTMAELSSNPNFPSLMKLASADIIINRVKALMLEYGASEEEANLGATFIKQHAGV
jgi:hypothetical protein